MLVPDSGEIFIDQRLLNNTKSNDFLLSWRSSLAYVSQNIYFMKGTFIENIAFGINHEDINFQRVKDVSKLAMIDDFISSKPKIIKIWFLKMEEILVAVRSKDLELHVHFIIAIIF